MGPLAHQFAVAEHQNLVGVADAAGALGHDEYGHIAFQLFDGLPQFQVGDKVQGAGGVIQNQDIRLPHQGPGNGQPLFLAAGQVPAVLLQLVVQLAGLTLHYLMGLGSIYGLPQFLVGGVFLAPFQVVPDAALKQGSPLGHHADAFMQGAFCVIFDVLAGDFHNTGGGVVEPGNQVHHGGFAAASTADDADGLTGLGGKVYIGNGFGAGACIGKGHKAIADWIKGILTAGIMSNLSGLFDDVNTQVGNIAQQVGTKPSSFEPRVFAMIESLSRNVVLPIAGIILTFIACYELIEMITQHNNMAQFEPALIMRWIFKTAISVWLISNTFDIVMAVFDVTQKVVSDSSSIIAGNTRVNDIGLSMLQSSLMQMDVGPLFGLFLQSFFIGITMRILSIVIFVIVYGRMIEIYCMVSLAPIPMATFGNHEQSHMGQNYLKCLFALGFQGFLILICVAIYAVLIQSVAISGDAINSIWSIVGYTVLLCFSLFKTSSVTKSVLGAH